MSNPRYQKSAKYLYDQLWPVMTIGVYLTIFGSIWLYMTNYDYIWPIMTIYDCIWLHVGLYMTNDDYIRIYDQLGLYMTIYNGLFLTNYAYMWPIMTIYDQLWLYMTIYSCWGMIIHRDLWLMYHRISIVVWPCSGHVLERDLGAPVAEAPVSTPQNCNVKLMR
jgi:hypothetical protein